jgi:hypothetical protein
MICYVASLSNPQKNWSPNLKAFVLFNAYCAHEKFAQMITSFETMTTNCIDSCSDLDNQNEARGRSESFLRSKFSLEEDDSLRSLVSRFGEHNWHVIAAHMPGRNPRQCRERWVNYLSPLLNTSTWTPAEDQLLIEKHAELGTKWVQIAKFFPSRTAAMVKNRFHVLSRKQVRDEELQRSCDPLLMIMVLDICKSKPTRNEMQAIRPKPPAIVEPNPPVDLDLEPWPETMDSEFFDFETD